MQFCRINVCVTLFLVSLTFASKLAAETEFLALQKRVTDIYERYSDAVVRVKAYSKVADADAGAEGVRISVKIGSGFFISNEGLILVNASRVADAERVVIEHRGTDYLANIVGMDEQINVALLKAEFLPDEFEFIRMNDATQLPSTGTLAVSISCPFTLSPAPRLTMVVGQDTKFLQRLFPTTYLRVDHQLSKGEGGGPIIDLQGRLIGMLIVSIQETVASYALPARAINKVKDDLLLEGRVVYASVGVEVEQHSLRGGESRVIVKAVNPESPADLAGIIPGDIVQRVGDYSINDISDFPNAMFFIRVGEFVTFELDRDGTAMEMNMQTVVRPSDEPFIEIKPLTRQEAELLVEDASGSETSEKPEQPQDEPGMPEPKPEVKGDEATSTTTIEEIPDAFSVDKDKPGPVLAIEE